MDLTNIPDQKYPKQEHFIEESLGLEFQPWDSLTDLRVDEIGRILLGLAHSSNNSILNTGYREWERVLTYRLESGSTYDAVHFRTHGDFGHKHGGTSLLHRYAKVVRFHGSNDLRVRFMMERSFISHSDHKPYLVGMYDRDYPGIATYLHTRDKTVAYDIASHILSGTFLFTDEEATHPDEPPMTQDQRYQSLTSVGPAKLAATD
ncbi:hypothetical protein PQQ86_39215 [Paraburkholderia sediminicola]|uniref:hypothetical protein n=1 Tax=Paraburkholderia sediminicola TaxID=458836 RepID=UPI0038B8684B